MKRILKVLVILVLFSVPVLAEETIAVFPFENKVKEKHNLTELAENEMTSLLVNQKRFEVVERKDIDKIIKEQHFSNSGIVNINQAVKIGKIKGIKYGVFGEITNVSYTSKELALITLQIKIVDIETAKVMFSKVYNAKPKGETSNDKEIVLSNMLKNKFKKDISNDLINTFAIEGSIIDIRGKRVIIDIGKKQGVVRGMEFNVIDTQEKTSKRNNEKIKIETPVAILEVQEVVSDNSSICKFKEGEKLEEGMTVKLVQVDDRYYKAEDIEKLLRRRGIQKGDLLVSAYGGGGEFFKMDFPFEHYGDSTVSPVITTGGLQAIIFVNSWLGLGLDGSIYSTNNTIYIEKSIYEAYRSYRVHTTNISLTGRINLSNASVKTFIPFGIGVAHIKHSTDIEENYGNYKYTEEKEENALYGYLGIGIEGNITNNVSIGGEFRYSFMNAETKINIPVLLLKLNYKFEEVIKL